VPIRYITPRCGLRARRRHRPKKTLGFELLDPKPWPWVTSQCSVSDNHPAIAARPGHTTRAARERKLPAVSRSVAQAEPEWHLAIPEAFGVFIRPRRPHRRQPRCFWKLLPWGAIRAARSTLAAIVNKLVGRAACSDDDPSPADRAGLNHVNGKSGLTLRRRRWNRPLIAMVMNQVRLHRQGGRTPWSRTGCLRLISHPIVGGTCRYRTTPRGVPQDLDFSFRWNGLKKLRSTRKHAQAVAQVPVRTCQ